MASTSDFKAGDDALCVVTTEYEKNLEMLAIYKVLDVTEEWVVIPMIGGPTLRGGWEPYRFVNVTDLPEIVKRINRSDGTRYIP